MAKKKNEPLMIDTITIASNAYNSWIDFLHIPTSREVRFAGTLTKFSDNIKQNWTEEKVYGRMDPILTYTGTDRKLNFSWNIIAHNKDEAIANFSALMLLAQMQYPVYESGTENEEQISGVLKAAPLFRIHIANLVIDSAGGSVIEIKSKHRKHEDPLGKDGYRVNNLKPVGLVCKMDGFEYNPDFTHGAFLEGGAIYAKYHEMKCSCTVLHTHNLGYNEEGKFRSLAFGAFPYDARGKGIGFNETLVTGFEDVPEGEYIENAAKQREYEEKRARILETIGGGKGNTITK